MTHVASLPLSPSDEKALLHFAGDTTDATRPEKMPGEIQTVYQLLRDNSLAIPQYQRPYKWTTRHIRQLLADIVAHSHKSAYRIGTIVLHGETEKNNIVDGQQRTISLILIIRALLEKFRGATGVSSLDAKLKELDERMINPAFSSEISQVNIHENYMEALRFVSDANFTKDNVNFFLNKCEVVIVKLADVSEAFQFFDSQNARGRELAPHDLLKAFHLRAFSQSDIPFMAPIVAKWESVDTDHLAAVFAEELYRIRSWSAGKSARIFTNEDNPLFKGVNIDAKNIFPFAEQLRVAHHFTDNYNRQYERRIDGQERAFPYQLDQIMINGRRFFDYIDHYREKIDQIRAGSWDHFGLDDQALGIVKKLENYPGRHRTGDRYVRSMFNCLLLFYIDKFGHTELSSAIRKIFIWSYSLRLQRYSVQLASMDNYVRDNNLFRALKEATHPSQFLNIHLPQVGVVNSNNTGEIVLLFKDMKYHG